MDTRSQPLQTNPSNASYRYGFNGKESDFEVKNGQGTSYDFGARIYDPRLGKFLSIDPQIKMTPYYSPYLFAGNKPINSIDKNGETEWAVINYLDNQGRLIKTQVRIVSSQEVYTFGTNNAVHTIDVRLDANNQIISTQDRGWRGFASVPAINAGIGNMTDNGRGRFRMNNEPPNQLLKMAKDFPSSIPMVDNVQFNPTPVSPTVPVPVAGFSTPMTGVNDNQTINDIATLWQNGSISGNITIQITSMNLPVGATPQFIANAANLNTARAQTIMQALTGAGVPVGQITILPTQRAATPSATVTYQRNLASAAPVSNTVTVPAGVQDSN